MIPISRRRLLVASATVGLLALAGPARTALADTSTAAAETGAKDLSVQSTDDGAGRQARLVDAINRLGLATLGEQAVAEPGTNHLVSPLSLAGALAVLAQGAGGTSAKRLLPALGGADADAAALAEAWHGLSTALTAGGAGRSVAWAAGLWHMPGLGVDKTVADRVADRMGGVVAGFDVAGGDPAAAINAWADDKTQGRIRTVFETLPTDTDLVVAGAMAFKGDWVTAFDPSNTAPKAFTRADGATREVATMSRADDAFAYAKTETWEAVLLPYAGDAIVLALALPAKGAGPESILGAGTDTRPAWLDPKAYAPRPGRLALPKLDLTARADLKNPAANATVAGLLDGQLDLTAFGAGWAGAPRAVGAAVQVAALRWDETGTEAAAVTALAVSRSMNVDENAPFTLSVDRPFAFALLHRATGTVLMAGTIAEPAA